MKKLLASLFLGVTLIVSAADIVYITPKGKKYHESKSYRSLKRSKIVKYQGE